MSSALALAAAVAIAGWGVVLAVAILRLELLIRQVRALVPAMPPAGEIIEEGVEPGAVGRGSPGDRTPPNSPPERPECG
jgi:hypothetical protein